jgi:hypothetical protein
MRPKLLFFWQAAADLFGLSPTTSTTLLLSSLFSLLYYSYSSLEVQVKALVVKALEEQGLSTEPWTVMAPPGELALVGSPPEVPSSQGSTAATTPVDRIQEPTTCTLVVIIGWQNTLMEVATGVAHPPGGQHHNNRIPPDYTRVEVHTVKPKFMQWHKDHPTPNG